MPGHTPLIFRWASLVSYLLLLSECGLLLLLYNCCCCLIFVVYLLLSDCCFFGFLVSFPALHIAIKTLWPWPQSFDACSKL